MGSAAPITLVVGCDCLLGRALMAQMQGAGHVVIGTTRRHEAVDNSHLYLDLVGDVRKWRCDHPVEVAVVCAAVTKLAACERDPEATARVNVSGISALTKNLVAAGAFIVFLSSNQVFDGSVPRRLHSDPVSPVSQYGRQKADVEPLVLGFGPMGSVVRFTKVLEPNAPLLHGWLQTLRKGEAIHPFFDMVMAPIPLAFAVNVLHRVAWRRLQGVVQVSGERDVTYAEAAHYLANRIGAKGDLIRPISAKEAGAQACAMPAYTTLDISRLRGELGMEPPDVWSTIDAALGL